MKNLRFGLAFCGVVLVLISSLTPIELSPYALTLFAALVVLSLDQLNRLALSFACAGAAVTLLVFLLDGSMVDLKAAAFIFAFLLVSGSLRTAAQREPTVQALGTSLADSPQRHRFTMISIGIALLSLVLLNGSLQLVAGIFSRKINAPLSQRLAIMRAMISGFALNPILSPIAIPFVVISSLLPSMSWTPLTPYLFACAIVVWIAGAIQAKATNNGAEHHSEKSASSENVSIRELLVAVLLVLAPVAGTIFLIAAFGLKPGQAALASIFLSSLIWPVFRLRRPDLIYAGYTVSINEATLVGSSILLGMTLVGFLPSEYGESATHLLVASGAAAPALILVFFVVGGMFGIQPSICFLLIYAMVASIANPADVFTAPALAAMIVGWALNSVVTQFGIPVMIVSEAFGLRSHEFAYRYGIVYLLLSVVGSAVVLALGSMLF
ncbi:MAG: hypothetical protein GKR97_20770 [Rhizobiaceae bacterium]|nr:hypothetical protein [Rhizobiaceae bacterium]